MHPLLERGVWMAAELNLYHLITISPSGGCLFVKLGPWQPAMLGGQRGTGSGGYSAPQELEEGSGCTF